MTDINSKSTSLVFSDNCNIGSLENIRLGLSFVSEAANRAAEDFSADAMKGLAAIVDVLRSALEVSTSKVRENEKELYREIKRLGDAGVRTV